MVRAERQAGETGMILVIDDEPGITELLSDVLEYHGYPVMVANDAEQALDMLPLQRPEAILIDIMMPTLDGLSLAVALRHDPDAKSVPLIAMSASDSALALARRTGDFDACIRKPFETRDLVGLIKGYSSAA